MGHVITQPRKWRFRWAEQRSHSKSRSSWLKPLLLTIIKHCAGHQDTTGNQTYSGSAPNTTYHDFIDLRLVFQKARAWRRNSRGRSQSTGREGLWRRGTWAEPCVWRFATCWEKRVLLWMAQDTVVSHMVVERETVQTSWSGMWQTKQPEEPLFHPFYFKGLYPNKIGKYSCKDLTMSIIYSSAEAEFISKRLSQMLKKHWRVSATYGWNTVKLGVPTLKQWWSRSACVDVGRYLSYI